VQRWERFFDNQVSIPIEIRAGQVHARGVAFPKLREGAKGVLVVSSSAIMDPRLRRRLRDDKAVPFLQEGALLYVKLNRGTFELEGAFAPPGLEERVCGLPGPFGELQLREPLLLGFRGTRLPTLLPARCFVRALDLEARSVNHGCTLLSQRYETKRISHTYNVFETVLWKDDKHDRLIPLDKLRRVAGIASSDPLDPRDFE
jgi:hypothetical protein